MHGDVCLLPAYVFMAGIGSLYFYLFTHDAGTEVVTALKLLSYYALTAAHVCSLYPASYGWLV